MPDLAQSDAYRQFVNQRDKALEEILHNYQRELTDLTNHLIIKVMGNVESHYERLVSVTTYYKIMEQILAQNFEDFVSQYLDLYLQMRKTVYFLTVQSEMEAIKRATNKSIPPYSIEGMVKDHLDREHGSSGDLVDRLEFGLTRLRNKVMDAIKLGVMNKDEKRPFLQRVFNQFPKYQKIDKRKPLKKLQEAGKAKGEGEFPVAMIDEDLWNEVIDDYEKEFLPSTRSPETVFDVEKAGGYKGADEEVVYGWEIERDMTHDFVVSVRQGMVDAAKQQGVTDFVIVAILDDRTCDSCCGDYGCADFDGKTTKEVEKMTKGAQVTPPFHFNCRCTLAPYTDDLPELEPSNEGDFDEWLNS